MWPTISTPCLWRLKSPTAITPNATATSEPGTIGAAR